MAYRDMEGWMDLQASGEFQSNSRRVYNSLNDKGANVAMWELPEISAQWDILGRQPNWPGWYCGAGFLCWLAEGWFLYLVWCSAAWVFLQISLHLRIWRWTEGIASSTSCLGAKSPRRLQRGINPWLNRLMNYENNQPRLDECSSCWGFQLPHSLGWSSGPGWSSLTWGHTDRGPQGLAEPMPNSGDEQWVAVRD